MPEFREEVKRGFRATARAQNLEGKFFEVSGEELLASAKKVADQAGFELDTELLQARDAAAAIVDTAVERKSDLIVVAMPFRKRLGRVYVGRTVQNVYVNAPCAVLAYRQEETR